MRNIEQVNLLSCLANKTTFTTKLVEKWARKEVTLFCKASAKDTLLCNGILHKSVLFRAIFIVGRREQIYANQRLPARHPQSAKNVGLRAWPIAATRLVNFHLVWISTGTFCLNVWKLLSSSMAQNVQQHHLRMTVADVFSSLICIRQITLLDAMVISWVDEMKDSSKMYGGWFGKDHARSKIVNGF